MYTSNTYLITHTGVQDAYLVDVGEYTLSRNFILEKSLRIKAVFLTHGHYDHILGINALIQDFPDCLIYAHGYTLKSLLDAKENLSFYREIPTVLHRGKVVEIDSNFVFELFPEYVIKAYETPGHNPGSICFTAGDDFFTGDSYIPFTPVFTRLKGGSKSDHKRSLPLIRNLIVDHTRIRPGHGRNFLGEEVQNDDHLLGV